MKKLTSVLIVLAALLVIGCEDPQKKQLLEGNGAKAPQPVDINTGGTPGTMTPPAPNADPTDAADKANETPK